MTMLKSIQKTLIQLVAAQAVTEVITTEGSPSYHHLTVMDQLVSNLTF